MAQFDYWQNAPEFEEKALSEDQSDVYVLRGWAATYEQDKVNDIIVPGAFKKCLDRMAQKGDVLPLYFNHKTEDAPLGRVHVVEERAKGLYFEAHMPREDRFVKDRIVPQIKSRALKSNSFGYKVRDFERKNGARLLKSIDIFEISVVGFPCGNGADIIGVKGLVGFQDLYIDRDTKSWDAEKAFNRLKDKFAGDPLEMKQAFLYADEALPVEEWDRRLLIADIDEKGRLTASQIAVFKSCAYVAGARGGVALPDEAESAVKDHLERYYSRMNLESAFSSLSADEFKHLDGPELEARLRGLGFSRKLATDVIDLRDADRSTKTQETASAEDAKSLLIAALVEAAAAIKQQSTAG